MTTLLISACLLAVSLLVSVPALVLFVQIVSATWRRPTSADVPTTGPRPGRVVVLMPAHDEAAGIATSIAAVLAQCGPADRLLVVADNCSDATAAVARAAGADVIERHDLSRRGKGYALDFGVRWLERDPPALVLIVDADCVPAPLALERIARLSLAANRPVQALYLMRAPHEARLGTRIAEFAWVVKNRLRPRGGARIGWPCQLMGSGMAFPWLLIQGAALASGHIVEDMQLGVALASAGTPPLFCEVALVESVFPADNQGAKSQRTRWEHGHLSMIASAAPGLLWRAVVRSDAALLGMVLDLIVPPLASLALVLGGLVIVNAVWAVAGGSGVPLAVSLAAWLLVLTSVVSAWRSAGRHIVSKGELFSLPLYILAKVPLYARLLSKRQVDWVRTKRDDQRR